MTEAAFKACIQKILSGDKQGLREIYDAYLNYIYRIVYGIVGRKEDAEDITSEFFIKLYTQADKIKTGSGHKGYLATVARNMALDHLRKYKKEVLDSFSKDDEKTTYTEPVSSDDTESTVLDEISVTEAVSLLTEKERQIINMKVLSEMTFSEISTSLSIPMGTVTWRYREAIKKLRRYGYYEES